MKNSPYLDKPFVPLAVALRSMLAETEAKIATAEPAEKARLQQRAEVLREWITPKSRKLLSTAYRAGSAILVWSHANSLVWPVDTSAGPHWRV